MALGNKHLGYKDALNAIEVTSPGSKHDFYFGFLSRASARFRVDAAADSQDLHPCPSCGAPTTAESCAFCRLVARAGGHHPVAVELSPTRPAPSVTRP